VFRELSGSADGWQWGEVNPDDSRFHIVDYGEGAGCQ